MESPPNKEIALAPVSVLWDMKRCPVPDGYDARRIGPCIKRSLRKLGYSGPITITAVGSLAKVPRDILEAVTSTGISLRHSPYSYKDLVSLFLSRDFESAPPSSMMVISRPSAATPPNFSPFLSELRGYGHNSIFPYPYDSPQQASSTHARCLWKNFLLAGALDEEDRCSDTGEPAFWVCTVCRRIGDPGLAGLGVVGRGVDNFITHLSTREHEVKLYQWFPPSGDVYSYLGEELEGFKEEYKGFDEEDEEARVEAPLVSFQANATTMDHGE